MSELQTMQQEVFDYIKNNLGEGMIEVELDPKHYETALERAINRYRQRSSNAVEESYAFITLKENQNKYILPDEVINVRKLFRRTVGSRTEGGQGGTLFEPFNLAYTNTYLLRAGATGGLATYYAFASYQELVGKLFGSFIQFHYDNATKQLTITQRPRADDETILMHTDNFRPDITLLKVYRQKIMAQEPKKIKDLSYKELEDMVIALENITKIATSPSMRDLILKTIRQTKLELEKRL